MEKEIGNKKNIPIAKFEKISLILFEVVKAKNTTKKMENMKLKNNSLKFTLNLIIFKNFIKI